MVCFVPTSHSAPLTGVSIETDADATFIKAGEFLLITAYEPKEIVIHDLPLIKADVYFQGEY